MAAEPDTIFAVASGFGRAAIAVIRISGARTAGVLDALAGGVPPARRLVLRALRKPETGETLDEGLVAWMPGPRSFTGEDQAELHIHGGLATRTALVRALSGLAGCRPALPGEFTRRAFLNGRMDLTRVEGLADLIDAETEAQRRQALRQLGGALGTKVEAWREGLLHALALLEASLDFADEGDVPAGLEDDALRRIRAVHADIGATLDEPSGERLREGFTIVIAGPPNAGKSTLLNALARRDVAIVSPIAGTTRDLIEVRCDLDGLPVLFVDTAGLRDSEDPVEQAGVDRARKRAADADLILWLVPPDGAGPPPEGSVLSVAAKADLRRDTAGELAVSAQTGLGMPDLLARIADLAQGAVGRGDAVVTRERHHRALREAERALGRGLALAADAGASELVAEDVRLATRAIGQITGRVDVEDVLDRLFSSFCIGK